MSIQSDMTLILAEIQGLHEKADALSHKMDGTSKKLDNLEHQVNLLSQGVSRYSSDVQEVRDTVIKVTCLAVGSVAICSIPVCAVVGISTDSPALMFGGAMSLCPGVAVAAFVPPLMNLERDVIIGKLKGFCNILTYKQASDMHKIVISLEGKHTDTGHYETRSYYRRNNYGGNDLIFEKVFIKKKNEMEPCAKFLVEKYMLELSKYKIPPFDLILENMKNWVIDLDPMIIA